MKVARAKAAGAFRIALRNRTRQLLFITIQFVWLDSPMRKLRFPVLLTLLACYAHVVSAQEFDCTVSVDQSQLEGSTSTFAFLKDLAPKLEEYINRHRWTEDRFEPEERIECTVNIQILESLTLTRFRSNIIVASKRPIYGTVQNTNVLRIIDEGWVFNYAEGTPILHNPDRFDELTTLIDYYANILLAYDYDTFEELGGSPYFEEARRISDLGKNEGALGWATLGGDRSRGDIVTEMLDPTFRKLRQVYFKYHLEGLDRFVTTTEEARQAVLSALQEIKELSENRARSYTIDLFFSAKSKEIAAIFKDSRESVAAYDLLAEIDTAHLSDYNSLVD